MAKGFQGRERDRFPKDKPTQDDLLQSEAALTISGQLSGNPDIDSKAIHNFAEMLAGARRAAKLTAKAERG